MIQTLTLTDAMYVSSRMRERDAKCIFALSGCSSPDIFAVSRWQSDGPAWALIEDDYPVAIFGLSKSTPWVAAAWLVTTREMSGQSWRKLIRHCRIVVGNLGSVGIKRVEASVLDGWSEAGEFAKRLGFELEGTRRAAGQNGEDVHMYALRGK